MDRRTSARIAGLAAWEKDRPRRLVACSKGGAMTLERHGRSHMVRIGAWRQGPICAGGLVQGRHIAIDGRAKCPTCGKRITVTRYNRMRAHKERKAA